MGIDHAHRARAELNEAGAPTVEADLQLGLVRLARGELTQARSDLQRVLATEAPGASVVARGALLACQTGDGDWSEWDGWIASWKAATAPARIVGRDTAWPLEWAGKRAEDAAAFERSATSTHSPNGSTR